MPQRASPSADRWTVSAQFPGAALETTSSNLSLSCTLQAEHGTELGWKAEYTPEHIIEAADAEVDLILRHV